MAKANFLKITSAKGQAFYAYLKTPEMYEGHPVGLTIQMKFDKDDTDKLIAKLEAELERSKKDPQLQGKKWRREPRLGFKEDKNGDIVFKFKTKHEYKKGDDIIKRTVPVFDAKGKPVDVNIGNGSICKVAFQVVPYHKSSTNNGITLYLDAVQLLELKEYGGSQKASNYGFGEEEGYEAEDTPANRFSEDDVEENPEVGEEEDF